MSLALHPSRVRSSEVLASILEILLDAAPVQVLRKYAPLGQTGAQSFRLTTEPPTQQGTNHNPNYWESKSYRQDNETHQCDREESKPTSQGLGPLQPLGMTKSLQSEQDFLRFGVYWHCASRAIG
jgi:hypothetical protein